MSNRMHKAALLDLHFLNLTAMIAGLIMATSYSATAQTNTAVADVSTPVSIPLNVNVQRVSVDIVVTDSKGRPVYGLKEEDFKIEEDTKKQPVRSFDIHSQSTSPDAFTPRMIPSLPPNTFLNLSKAPESGTPTVILYDSLNTPLDDQRYLHDEMIKLLRKRRNGTQIAIFVLLDKLYLLQGFTDDTSLLNAALASNKAKPQTTLLAPTLDFASTPMDDPPASVGDTDTTFEKFLAKAREMEQLNQQQILDKRVEITLQGLTEVGRFLGSMPGRKDLIWLSAGFPVGIVPDPTMTTDNTQHDRALRDYSGQIRQATDLLNSSHVSVYPVDARGLRVNPDLNAASSSGFGANPSFSQTTASLQQARSEKRFTTSNSINLSQQTFLLDDQATRTTMDSIANATGGHAYYGTNGLQGAVDSALVTGSTYYTLTYAPTNSTYDGSLRHIKVTLNRPGYNLAYRKVYYADDLTAATRAVADAPESPLLPSLERGTPLAHGLLLEAHLEPYGTPAPATPEQLRTMTQYGSRELRPTSKPAPVLMQTYQIVYGLIARQFDTPADPTGNHQASLELGVIAYDDDGRKLTGTDTHIEDAIPPARFAKIATDGYHVAQSIAIPTTAASLRLAVRDTHSNRTASLEVKLPLKPTTPAKAP